MPQKWSAKVFPGACLSKQPVNFNSAFRRGASTPPVSYTPWCPVGRSDLAEAFHNALFIETVELGPIKAECYAFDVTCAVRIEPDVPSTDALVVRTSRAACPRPRFHHVTRHRSRIGCHRSAFGLLRRVDDGDFALT